MKSHSIYLPDLVGKTKSTVSEVQNTIEVSIPWEGESWKWQLGRARGGGEEGGARSIPHHGLRNSLASRCHCHGTKLILMLSLWGWGKGSIFAALRLSRIPNNSSGKLLTFIKLKEAKWSTTPNWKTTLRMRTHRNQPSTCPKISSPPSTGSRKHNAVKMGGSRSPSPYPCFVINILRPTKSSSCKIFYRPVMQMFNGQISGNPKFRNFQIVLR